MSKWAGNIGFATSTEVKPGIWKDVITDRAYKGDEHRISRRLQSADRLGENPVISNTSMIAFGTFFKFNSPPLSSIP